MIFVIISYYKNHEQLMKCGLDKLLMNANDTFEDMTEQIYLARWLNELEMQRSCLGLSFEDLIVYECAVNIFKNVNCHFRWIY